MKPKVTIGICVRNSASTLRETIESVMAQDYPHELIEVIFVDDGSTDETPSIINDYASKMGVKVKIFHHEWKGLGYSRNVVVNNAEGKYIVWVDSDMVLSKDFIKKLVDFMEQNPNVGIAKGKQALIPGKNTLATLEAYSRAVGRMVDYTSDKSRFKALGTGGAIYKRQIFEQVGDFDEKLRGYNEDWDLEMRVRAAGWQLSTVDAYFLDHERLGLTWKGLWIRYWIRGYHTHYFLHKNGGVIKHYRMFPPASVLTGLVYALKLYKLTCQKIVFALPLQLFFKMTAWYAGFIRSHLDSYSPILK
ncbi:MAG: glycosyltransferase [Candidatus Bathyarchaeota archaeon]|jgi:glycosyltransferase involved in cell wall biosynthesis|nr:glycosyltransferase [Candidatus Bathyarchaeota archaeon]